MHLRLHRAGGNSDNAEFAFSTEENTGSSQYFSTKKPQAMMCIKLSGCKVPLQLRKGRRLLLAAVNDV